ncbi:MAG: alpha/beta fold hydrolase [Methyloligellaceae bacterium]
MSPITNVVLVPGFMCDSGLWDDMTGALGVLGSLHHADLSRDDALESMAERLLRDAPPRFLLVGFSMGGYVARRAAIAEPDRVAGLVLINTSARGDTAERQSRKPDMIEMARRSTFRGLTRSALKAAVHPERQDNPALLDRIQAMALRLGKDTFLRQLALVRHDEHDQLGGIACPALVVASRHDQLRSLAEAEELAAGIAGSEYRVLEGSGHMSPFEEPHELAALIVDWTGRLGVRD